jgi:hypothetical protein
VKRVGKENLAPKKLTDLDRRLHYHNPLQNMVQLERVDRKDPTFLPTIVHNDAKHR